MGKFPESSTADPLTRIDHLLNRMLKDIERYYSPDEESDAAIEHWQRLYGGKETALSVLTKCLNMKKTVLELQDKQQQRQEAQPDAPGKMTDQDWELLEICVDRHRGHGPSAQPEQENVQEEISPKPEGVQTKSLNAGGPGRRRKKKRRHHYYARHVPH